MRSKGLCTTNGRKICPFTKLNSCSEELLSDPGGGCVCHNLTTHPLYYRKAPRRHAVRPLLLLIHWAWRDSAATSAMHCLSRLFASHQLCVPQRLSV